jgi:hypothetical protein
MLARLGTLAFLIALLLSSQGWPHAPIGDSNPHYRLNIPAGFDVGGAMTSLYGDYDPPIYGGRAMIRRMPAA